MKKLLPWLSLSIAALAAPSCIHVERRYEPGYDPNCEPYEAPRERYQPPEERSGSYDRPIETVHVMIGEMNLSDDGFWSPLDEPWSFGIEYASTTTKTGFGPELGLHFWGDSTGSSSSDEDLGAIEFSVGVRNTWDPGRNRPHPYIGVGGTFLAANLQGPGYDESDGSIGLYGHAGITIPLGPGMDIGVDYRVVRGTESDLPGLIESDYDYDRLALVLGWSF